MSADQLLQAVLARLSRGDCPDAKYPDAKGEYWALCPYHADTHSGNFSVSKHGFKCFACNKSGGLRDLGQKLGVDVLTYCSGGSQQDLFLIDYAREKKLPVDSLISWHVGDRKQRGRNTLRMSYLDEAGREAAVRYRSALSGADRFRWARGSKLLLYGLWRLDRSAGYVILVEGESDAHTLWYHNFPALGIPGASTWQPEWARFVDGLTVYVWQEPDRGGATLVNAVGQSLPDCFIITPTGGRKDISECHIAGDDVAALVAQLIADARPYRQLQAQAVNKDAAEARRLARSLIECPSILDELVKLCELQGLIGEQRIAKLIFLAVTSRLRAKPVSVAVKGPSSGGKSYVVETVLRAFPASAFYALSSMSERALAYSEEPLKNRILVLYEAAGMAGDFGTYLMRTLLSEGCIRYETVEKTNDGLKPKLIEREGPTGLLVTTTSTGLHPENETRMFSVTVRDDRQQTQGILQSLADRANGSKPAEPDFTPWHALQCWLELAGCREVSIPFAHKLAELADSRAVRLRRDFGAVLNLIATHAMLHQELRARDAGGRIVAGIDDYAAVFDVVSDSLNQGVQAAVSPAVRALVEAVKALDTGGAPVSFTRLAEYLDIDKAAVSRRVKSAVADGYLVNAEDRRGKPARLSAGDPLPRQKSVLPAPADLEKHLLSDPAINASTRQHPAAGDADRSDLEPWQLSYLAEVEAMTD